MLLHVIAVNAQFILVSEVKAWSSYSLPTVLKSTLFWNENIFWVKSYARFRFPKTTIIVVSILYDTMWRCH